MTEVNQTYGRSAQRSSKQSLTPRLCDRCGHGFWSTGHHHRFCSLKCRSEAAEARLEARTPAPAGEPEQPREVDPRAAYILAEWTSGRPLTAIAGDLGITREWASRLIGRLDGKARPFITVGEASRTLGIDDNRVRRWVKSGLLLTEGGLVTVGDVQIAHEAALLLRHCRTCGAAFKSLNPKRVHCDLHVLSAGAQPKYAEWSAARRKMHRRLTERWKAEHPELVVAMNRRAHMVWKLTKAGVDRTRARELARATHPDPAPKEIAS